MSGGGTRDDRRFMEQALALAALGEGTTSPNPRVGCLLVRDGEVVGQGFHEAPGLPHAEARAVAEAGERTRGATAFVNLEPCAHHGRTPPCADLLVERRIARVVASTEDPNPVVGGRGFGKLREAGIRVDVGCLEGDARRLNAPFFHTHARGRPFVTLKAALSLDGMIAAAGGRSRWITGEPARRFAHRLRLARDAVLVGAGTVRRDDPLLTVRLPGVSAARLRAVLAPDLAIAPGARLFEGDPSREILARIYVSERLKKGAATPFDGRAEVVPVAERGGGLDLEEVLADLASAGAQSVLVEGGGKTLAAFLEAGLADEVALFVAPVLLGGRGGTPLLERATVREPALGWRLEEVRRIPLGQDLLVVARPRPAGS